MKSENIENRRPPSSQSAAAAIRCELGGQLFSVLDHTTLTKHNQINVGDVAYSGMAVYTERTVLPT